MTSDLFFDTDCLSSFLWVKNENILLQLYPGRIILPQQVFAELQNPKIPHIATMVKTLCSNGDISTKQILANTEEYSIYYDLAVSPPKGQTVIGKGEAAAIALAKTYRGIIASNNLRDICPYIEKYNLNHVTTGDIMVAALAAGLINEATGNTMWTNMLAKKRLLPTRTFSDYLQSRE